MSLGDPLKPSYKTSYQYLSYPPISEQSVQWLLRTHPERIWVERKQKKKNKKKKQSKYNKSPDFIFEDLINVFANVLLSVYSFKIPLHVNKILLYIHGWQYFL